MSNGIHELRQWILVHALVTCGTLCRSFVHLNQVIDQFQVESNPRYEKRINQATGRWQTWCNIFARDVTRAMGCEIPQCVYDGAGKGHELSANDQLAWLLDKQVEHGWREVNSHEAIMRATNGFPTVACGQAHIAMVIGTDSIDMLLAQAGGMNRRSVRLCNAFDAHKRIQYFTHD